MRTGHKGNLKFIFWDGASSLTLPTHSSLCWQKVLTKTKIWPSLSAWELCFLHPLQNEIQPLTWIAGHFPAGPHTASPASHLWRPWAPIVLISSWLAQLHVGPQAWDPPLPVLTLPTPQTSPPLWSPLLRPPKGSCLSNDNTPLLIPTASGTPPGQGSGPLLSSLPFPTESPTQCP